MGNVSSRRAHSSTRQAQRHPTQPRNDASSLLSSMRTSSTLTVIESVIDATESDDQPRHLKIVKSETKSNNTEHSDHYSEATAPPAAPDPIRLPKDHADLTEIDPATLTIALFNAMGYSIPVNSDARSPPLTKCVIYMEFIEDKARGNSSRTHPAASLSEAAQSFFSRLASLTPPSRKSPDLLTTALFNAMGYSNDVRGPNRCKFYPPTEFVVYLEFIEDKARGNANRTHPAASLYEAAHNFFSRPALPPAFTPSFPRNLATSVFSDPIRHPVANAFNLSHMLPTRAAELLFDSLGLMGFGPCPSPEFVILLEFVASQVLDTTFAGTAPAESLVGAVYQFLFRRAAIISRTLPPRSPALDSEAMARDADEALLSLLGGYPDLRDAHPTSLSRALYRCIGLETDPSCTMPDPASVIHAEFLDDQRHYTPDRAVPAKTLVDAASYEAARRRVESDHGEPATLLYRGCD